MSHHRARLPRDPQLLAAGRYALAAAATEQFDFAAALARKQICLLALPRAPPRPSADWHPACLAGGRSRPAQGPQVPLGSLGVIYVLRTTYDFTTRWSAAPGRRNRPPESPASRPTAPLPPARAPAVRTSAWQVNQAAIALDEVLLRQAEREYDFEEKAVRGAPAATKPEGAGPARAPATPKRSRAHRAGQGQTAQQAQQAQQGKRKADATHKAGSWSGWNNKGHGGSGGKWQRR